MMPPHKLIKKYANYEIFLRLPGFESFQNSFGKVTSFVIRDKDNNVPALFAFAYSGLDAIQDTNINDDVLLNKAVSKIEQRISNKDITSGSEYTYIYTNGEFIEDTQAKWWIRTSTSPSQ